jgi:DNA invertase Pin-like site-specific DNA recombinase
VPVREKRPGVNGELRRIGGYLRVSSKSQTAAMQRDAIERVASARGELVGHWYEDRLTGGGRHPPELVRVLEDARRGELVRLYVYRLDRLGRRGIRDLLGIVHELEHAGVELVTIADGFTLEASGPTRELFLAFLAWAAHMERLAIGERIADARVRVEAEGGAWGRPRRMTPRKEREARELAKAGHSVRYIAARLKVPRTTIGRALSQKPTPKGGLKKAPLRRM